MAKKPIYQFEDELHQLIDRYLIEGDVSPNQIEAVLKNEVDANFATRLKELLEERIREE